MITGCSSPTRVDSLNLTIYDNKGGVSHGGKRIEFDSSGTCKITTYSDVIGAEKHKDATYKKEGETYIIKEENTEIIYHKVKIGKVEYLLQPKELASYNISRDKSDLRTALRKLQ